MTHWLRRALPIVLVTAAVVAPSAAYGAHVFGDVPEDSPHAAGIAYVDSKGITHGCDAQGNYCPSKPVGRDEMATFLYRASGNDPGTAPSVNADRVDGLDSTELRGQTGARGPAGPAGPAGPPGPTGGFGTFYNASTFSLTSSGCPSDMYRLVVVRQFGTTLPWQPVACRAAYELPINQSETMASTSGEASTGAPPPAGLFTDSTSAPYANGGVLTCAMSNLPSSDDGFLSVSCGATTEPGDLDTLAAYLATQPESNPVLLYRMP
jgi:hypothetical protein